MLSSNCNIYDNSSKRQFPDDPNFKYSTANSTQLNAST